MEPQLKERYGRGRGVGLYLVFWWWSQKLNRQDVLEVLRQDAEQLGSPDLTIRPYVLDISRTPPPRDGRA